MLVLGIDPGTATTGYGLVRQTADGGLEAVAYGAILTPAKTPMPDRLAKLYSELKDILSLHRPDSSAVEKLFFQKNVKTALSIGQGRGVVLLALAGKEGSSLGTAGFFVAACAVVGAAYGSNLALFPSITKDFYGMKNFGMNYGLVFTSWGVGGFVLALLAAKVYDRTQSFAFAMYTSAALLIAAAVMTFFVKPPVHKEAVDA